MFQDVSSSFLVLSIVLLVSCGIAATSLIIFLCQKLKCWYIRRRHYTPLETEPDNETPNPSESPTANTSKPTFSDPAVLSDLAAPSDPAAPSNPDVPLTPAVKPENP